MYRHGFVGHDGANSPGKRLTVVRGPRHVERVVGKDGHGERWTGVSGVREALFEVVFDLGRAMGLACARIPGYRDECHPVNDVEETIDAEAVRGAVSAVLRVLLEHLYRYCSTPEYRW